MAIVLTLLVGLVFAAWFYFRRVYSVFSSRGVKHLPPLPIIGNMASIVFRREHTTTAQTRAYNAFRDQKFYGAYEFTSPVIYVSDPELLRTILIKEFDHFSVRRHFPVDEDDPFLSKSLMALKGDRWRDMRSTLSPAFTGSKLRAMVALMRDCSRDLLDHLKEELKTSADGCLDVDAKDICSRYATDVIATCAFGLQVNSLRDSDNQFHEAGKQLTAIDLSSVIKSIIMSSIPFYKHKKGDSQGTRPCVAFLREIIFSTMRARQENNSTRPDLIQLLIEAKKGTLKHETDNGSADKDAGFATVEESEIGKGAITQAWSDEDLFAQTLVFFFAGFDTVSSAMAFLLHELAVNPDVQRKLQDEVDQAWIDNKGGIEYDKLNQLKYLDMVVSESLRKWPPSIAGFRTCTKKFNLGKPSDSAKQDFTVDVGRMIVVPTWAIHHDPLHYPEPDKFDPERFSEENKHLIKPFTYMPFGIGPRNCIGSRFALMELKMMTFELVRNVEVLAGPRTAVSGKIDQKSFRTSLEGGHWLKFKLRKHSA